MKRVSVWVAGLLAVAAVVGGCVWYFHDDGRVTYDRRDVAVGSYGPVPGDTAALSLRSAILSSGDRDAAATVVSESSSRVVVAMSYEQFNCNGCARTAVGFLASATVHLRAPLGGRVVVDRLTGRPVRYAANP
ncbi:hypothetical protein [Allobranchiibius sp. GilTou73]|uniref:hypothetical protein n=1 Tax=Allobranchiibius sp. GilTou73 TaxID=2904523 RepID=UPI001F29AFCC|nr:hypothetical protein [Allobranchiibius sp. GilTou73]UIJ33920.1 hypothetical protein LVQ62_12320 [Allobranchiibius sp. GilTou73]